MPPNDLHNPHDVLFKEMFSQQEIAADFLRNYLPPKVVAHLQLDALDVQPDSFIDEELREHYSDLLFRAPLIDPSDEQDEAHADAQVALVYILFEHKSYNDRQTPFQLLRYNGAHLGTLPQARRKCPA
jgi:predicted transposase/invertase (TIGR01784 family)